MKGIISLILIFLSTFYILSGTYSTMEASAADLTSNWGGAITNESLGAVNENSSVIQNVTADYIPMNSPTALRNESGAISACGAAPCYTVRDVNAGLISINTSGIGTTGNTEIIYVDYTRNPEISNITGLSGLPGVAILLLVLGVIFGLVGLAMSKTGVSD